MIRNFKAIGLTVIAVLAMSAVVASAAQAAKGKITATSYPATLTGAQATTNNLKIGGGVREVLCTTATFAGTIVENAASRESVTVTPSYSGCTASPGALTAHVDTIGCDYTLENPSSVNAKITVGVTCGAGGPIGVQITEAGGNVLCEYTVATQAGLTGSSYVNQSSGLTEDILLTLNVSPTTEVMEGSKILCGASKGSHVATTITGTVTVKADKDEVGGAQVGVMIG